MNLDVLHYRQDRPYDEQSVSSIRFPNGSLCEIVHHPAGEFGPLSGIVADEALKMWALR